MKNIVGRTVVFEKADVNQVCTVEKCGPGTYLLKDQNTGEVPAKFDKGIAQQLIEGKAPNMQLI